MLFPLPTCWGAPELWKASDYASPAKMAYYWKLSVQVDVNPLIVTTYIIDKLACYNKSRRMNGKIQSTQKRGKMVKLEIELSVRDVVAVDRIQEKENLGSFEEAVRMLVRMAISELWKGAEDESRSNKTTIF